MSTFLVQSDYLYKVQTSFVSGAGRLDLTQVFGLLLLFIIPLVGVALLWQHRSIVSFFVMRFVSSVFFSGRKHVIENYLVTKGVVIELTLLDGKRLGRHLCYCRVESVFHNRMQLVVAKADPTRLNLKGKRVLCFVKQFNLSGKKYNSFVTYVHDFERVGTSLRSLQLLTPVGYQFTIRRKYVRKKINKPDAIRVKVWDIAKKRDFVNRRPDIATVKNPKRYAGKPYLSVGNISPGGIRLLVHNAGKGLPSLTVNNPLVMRVSIKDPGTRQFFFITVIGTIRSRFSAGKGVLGLGVQFTAQGESLGDGSGQHDWKRVNNGITALEGFLKKIAK